MKTTNTTKDDVSLFFLVQNYLQNYNFLTCTGTCMQVGLVLYLKTGLPLKQPAQNMQSPFLSFPPG